MWARARSRAAGEGGAPVSEVRDDAELHRLLQRLTDLGATDEELEEALRTGQLSDLALDIAIRPSGETVDLDQFIESSGLEENLVRELWSALGFAAAGPVRVTPDLAEAIRFLIAMAGLFQRETSFAMARVMGSTSSRLAEALIGAFRVDV